MYHEDDIADAEIGEFIRLNRKELEDIQHAMAYEEGSISELFRSGLRLALLVGVMLSVFGQLSGVNIVVYYGPKILAAAGFEEVATLPSQLTDSDVELPASQAE